MKWWYLFFAGVVLLVCAGAALWFFYEVGVRVALEPYAPSRAVGVPDVPEAASFSLRGDEVVIGQRNDLAFVHEPVVADFNGDSVDDVALRFVESGANGSTTSFLAVAVYDSMYGGYLGTTAVQVPQGDEVSLSAWHELLVLNDPTSSSTPTRYYSLYGALLHEIGPFAQGVQVGTAHAFYAESEMQVTLCTDRNTYTVAESSRAYGTMRAVAEERLGTDPYGQVFMVIAWIVGADPDSANPEVLVEQVLAAPSSGACAEGARGVEPVSPPVGNESLFGENARVIDSTTTEPVFR